MTCVFCGIVENKLEHYLIYEDDICKAFLDIRPVRSGTVLVIPKTHTDHVIDLDDETASHLLLISQKIARKIKSKLQPKRVGYVVSGYGVPHVHFIVIPTWNENDITSQAYASVENGEVKFAASNAEIASDELQVEVMNKLKLK